ncbi:MAG: hypothetical protein EYC70_02265 [Planctomycetota bacterium]|nr:MAG: hypothetical protein EYC70_02265 [Planctomycetota bacterium]
MAALLPDEEATYCDAAAKERVFCRGFDRFPTALLRERFAWLTHGDESLSREQLLDLIRRWIHAREFVLGLPSACDVMALECELCRGWDSFPNEKLAATHRELFGSEVRVLDDVR